MTSETHITISAEDRKEINAFARQVKGLPIFSHCQIAVRCFEGAEHANLAYFGIREPGTIGATDLADFGPRLADLRQLENHPSGYVVADFYTYGRHRVGGDLELDTNVQAVWFQGVLVALSEGPATVEWLVDADWFAAHTGEREAVLVSRHLHREVGFTVQRFATHYRVLISWPDGTDSSIGDWSAAATARFEARKWIEQYGAGHMRPSRERIDRTTEHVCEGLAKDAAYFAGQARPFLSCANCEAPIDVHYVQFASLCATCRRECTDESDVAPAACAWCGQDLDTPPACLEEMPGEVHCHRLAGHDGACADWAPEECVITDCACTDWQRCGHFDVRRPTAADATYRCSDCGRAL